MNLWSRAHLVPRFLWGLFFLIGPVFCWDNGRASSIFGFVYDRHQPTQPAHSGLSLDPNGGRSSEVISYLDLIKKRVTSQEEEDFLRPIASRYLFSRTIGADNQIVGLRQRDNELGVLILDRLTEAFLEAPNQWDPMDWVWHLRTLSVVISRQESIRRLKAWGTKLQQIAASGPALESVVRSYWSLLQLTLFSLDSVGTVSTSETTLMFRPLVLTRGSLDRTLTEAEWAEVYANWMLTSFSPSEPIEQHMQASLVLVASISQKFKKRSEKSEFRREMDAHTFTSFSDFYVTQGKTVLSEVPRSIFRENGEPKEQTSFVNTAQRLKEIAVQLSSDQHIDQPLVASLIHVSQLLLQSYFSAASSKAHSGHGHRRWRDLFTYEHQQFMLLYASLLNALGAKTSKARWTHMREQVDELATVLLESSYSNLVWAALSESFSELRNRVQLPAASQSRLSVEESNLGHELTHQRAGRIYLLFSHSSKTSGCLRAFSSGR